MNLVNPYRFKSGVPDGLIAYFPLQNNGNDVIGGITPTTNSNVTFSGTRANFTTSGAYLEYADDAVFRIPDATQKTISFTINFAAINSVNYIMGKSLSTGGATNREWESLIIGVNDFTVRQWIGTSLRGIKSDAPTTWATGVDYTVYWTIIGNPSPILDNLFRNQNIVDDDLFGSGNIFNKVNAPFQLGRILQDSRDLDGYIKFLGFWDRALTPAEVATYSALEQTGTPLVT